MSAIFFSIDTDMPIMVIPDTQAHANGHDVITYTYSVYRDTSASNPALERSKESELHLQKHTDPNYMGYITFEDPGKLFTYTADGKQELSSDQVEEIIEQISHYRDNPSMWRHLHQ
ncbi:hypothetical protein MUGA111182_18750 [Mucilaginibacter galii]|uniref:Uncharacterized protein n=1 Tax=Mucilaginibacter galii TaxID=2005073 RepID=A0A917N3T4_9SPHI|nr:hypothetical protein [Mucilaginibacter galii]GGI51322.1 hypothetical protein GCM10011425_25340 [Mucilaginibacter galii]